MDQTESENQKLFGYFKERCYDLDMDHNVCVLNAVPDQASAQNRFIVAADATAFETQSLQKKRFATTAPR